MARIAEPWRWEARKGWYAWVDNRRIRLCSLAEGKRAAIAELARLVELAGSPDAAPPPKVVDIMADYLADVAGRVKSGDIEPRTKIDITMRMAGFAASCGDLDAAGVKVHHVESWLKTRANWGPTMRNSGVGAVKTMFRWAARQGKIDRNPIADMAKPPKKLKRDTIPTAIDVDKAMGAVLNGGLRDLLTFIFETGCRPKEARTMEARHIDGEGGRVILPPEMHKTGKKTGKDRVIYLTPAAAEIAKRLAEISPEGPIFRNRAGTPWLGNSLVSAMNRLRRRAGLGKGVVAYGLRHLWISDGLAGGVSPAIVAEMAGHADLSMLATYCHISDRHDMLREAADKIRGKD